MRQVSQFQHSSIKVKAARFSAMLEQAAASAYHIGSPTISQSDPTQVEASESSRKLAVR